MAAVHIRNVPDETVALLKRRAVSHGRSLEAELRDILATAAESASRTEVGFSAGLTLCYATESPREWTRNDAYGYEDADV